jgi:DNA invertase Pin-like site-specific DNA recombinase
METRSNTTIIYCRVSSSDQVEGTSLESQERICREHAARQGLVVEAVFVERGESAKTADRTELKRAVAHCHRHHTAVFLVYKIDRFSRNQDDHVDLRRALRVGGTELRSATEPIDSTPTGRAMEGMMSVWAELDNNVRTERAKQGMLERVKQGMWVWRTPLGYMRSGPSSNIIPDPEKAPLIRLMFTEYSKGTFSYAELARLLAHVDCDPAGEERLTRPRSAACSTVRYMLV